MTSFGRISILTYVYNVYNAAESQNITIFWKKVKKMPAAGEESQGSSCRDAAFFCLNGIVLFTLSVYRAVCGVFAVYLMGRRLFPDCAWIIPELFPDCIWIVSGLFPDYLWMIPLVLTVQILSLASLISLYPLPSSGFAEDLEEEDAF